MNKTIITVFSVLLVIWFIGLCFFQISEETTTSTKKTIARHSTSCGNGVCEYHLGEHPLNCPIDCFLS